MTQGPERLNNVSLNVSLQSPLMDSLAQEAVGNSNPNAFDLHPWENFPQYTINDDFCLHPWDVSLLPGQISYGFPGDTPPFVTPPSTAGISENVLDVENDMTALCTGFTGDLEPYLSQRYQFDSQNKCRIQKITHLNLSTRFDVAQFILTESSLYAECRQEAGHMQIPIQSQREELEALISADVGRRLIELYRCFITPQYPIFSASSPLDPILSPPHLLAAVYAIVQPFVRYDEYLAIEFVYQVPPYTELSQLAYRGLQPQLHSPSLSTVQTLLLLLVRPSTNTTVSESPMKWTLLCTLVAAAHALGLHYDPKCWSIPSWQIAQRRRISFLIYATDKWLACSLGRPPLLNHDNWLVTSLAPDDELQAEIAPSPWSCLLTYSELCRIIEKVLCDLL